MREPATTLIDFATGAPATGMSYRGRLSFGPITFSQCSYVPNEDRMIGSSQVKVAVHLSKPYVLEWWNPLCDRIERRLVSSGQMHFNRANVPIFRGWHETLDVIAIACDSAFVSQTGEQALGYPASFIPDMVGVTDATVNVWQRFAAGKSSNTA